MEGFLLCKVQRNVLGKKEWVKRWVRLDHTGLHLFVPKVKGVGGTYRVDFFPLDPAHNTVLSDKEYKDEKKRELFTFELLARDSMNPKKVKKYLAFRPEAGSKESYILWTEAILDTLRPSIPDLEDDGAGVKAEIISTKAGTETGTTTADENVRVMKVAEAIASSSEVSCIH
jgi:hypothetical protein